jgi:hypothetical protein
MAPAETDPIRAVSDPAAIREELARTTRRADYLRTLLRLAERVAAEATTEKGAECRGQ